MTIKADEFRNAMQYWASGVTVVTAKTEQAGVVGMTATSFASVSLDPPQILVCINESAVPLQGIFDSQGFAVNILRSDQSEISNQFAGGITQEERFSNVAWHEGDSGSPILEKSLATVDCKVVQKVLSGTHWIIVGEVIDVISGSGDPLLYYRAGYRNLQS